jgi:hypothetical protein
MCRRWSPRRVRIELASHLGWARNDHPSQLSEIETNVPSGDHRHGRSDDQEHAQEQRGVPGDEVLLSAVQNKKYRPPNVWADFLLHRANRAARVWAEPSVIERLG